MEVTRVTVSNMSGSVNTKAELYPSGLMKFDSGEWSHIAHEKSSSKTILTLEEKPIFPEVKASEPRSKQGKKKNKIDN